MLGNLRFLNISPLRYRMALWKSRVVCNFYIISGIYVFAIAVFKTSPYIPTNQLIIFFICIDRLPEIFNFTQGVTMQDNFIGLFMRKTYLILISFITVPSLSESL